MMRHHYCRVIIMMLITALLSPSHAVLMKRSAAPVPVQSSSTTKKVCGLFVLVAVSLFSQGCIENPNVTFRRDYLTRTTLEERESMQRSITQTLTDNHGASEIHCLQEPWCFQETLEDNYGAGCQEECRVAQLPPVSDLNATASSSNACLLPTGKSYRGLTAPHAELWRGSEHGALPVFRMPVSLYPEIAQIMAFGHGLTHPEMPERDVLGDWTIRVAKYPAFRQWLQNDVVPELARRFHVEEKSFQVVQTGQIWMRGTGALEKRESRGAHVDLLKGKKFGMACSVYGRGTLLTEEPVDTAVLWRGGERSCPAAIEAGEGACVPIIIPRLPDQKARLVVHAVPGTEDSARRRGPIPGTEKVLERTRGPVNRIFAFVGFIVKPVPGGSS